MILVAMTPLASWALILLLVIASISAARILVSSKEEWRELFENSSREGAESYEHPER